MGTDTRNRFMTMPVAFFGHGSPMNTLEINIYTDAWRRYGLALPRPRVILVVSAHWYTAGTRVTALTSVKTIHDFNARFPRPLFNFSYPAPGCPELMQRIATLLAPLPVERDTTWGFDHGAFSVLAHLFPAADIPVGELSIDRRKSAREHFELAQRLAPLRDEGVFIFGSGNIVHNIELARFGHRAEPYAWAQRFEARTTQLVAQHEAMQLVEYLRGGDDARLSVPTPDHYLPFLYVLALQRDSERSTVICDGIEGSAISMLSLAFGA